MMGPCETKFCTTRICPVPSQSEVPSAPDFLTSRFRDLLPLSNSRLLQLLHPRDPSVRTRPHVHSSQRYCSGLGAGQNFCSFSSSSDVRR